MGKLTIKFQFMFLLTGHKRGGIVLLPADGHIAKLEVLGTPEKRLLTGHQVDIVEVASGKRIWGTKSNAPRKEPVVKMSDIFGADIAVARTYIEDPVDPTQLHARFVLGGGDFVDKPASDPRFSEVKWHFVTPDDKKKSQKLTDSMWFEFDLKSDHRMVFKDRHGHPLKPIPLPANEVSTILVENNDVVKPKMAGADTAEKQDYLLEEFHKLYRFLGPGERPIGPVGRGPKKTGFFGNGEPICGGGQSDPEEPSFNPPEP